MMLIFGPFEMLLNHPRSPIHPDRQGDRGADGGRVADLVLRQRAARPLDEAERGEAEGRGGGGHDAAVVCVVRENFAH